MERGDFMSPAGRPKKDNSRNCSLNLRLTDGEKQKIQDCAEILNLSRTDTIMKGIDMVKKELDKK